MPTPRRTTRAESQAVYCSRCGAQPGQECDNREGASHAERHEAAIAAGARVMDRRELFKIARYHREARKA